MPIYDAAAFRAASLSLLSCACSRPSIALAVVLLVLRLPLAQPWEAAIAGAFALLCAAGTARGIRMRAAAMLVSLVFGSAAWLVEVPVVHEGFQVVAPARESDAAHLREALPPHVHDQVLAMFDRAYPQAQRCDPAAAGCWRYRATTAAPLAWSADAAWRASPLSRSATGVSFETVGALRPGFLNEDFLNWFGSLNDMSRDSVPLVYLLRLPYQAVGGEICWRGAAFLPGEGDAQAAAAAGARCRAVTSVMVERTLVFARIGQRQELAVHLSMPASGARAGVLRMGVQFLTAAAALLLSVRWGLSAAGLVLPVAGAVLAALWLDPGLLTRVPILQGGNDGLFYEGAGRQIARDLLAGNVLEALRGGESVYFFQIGYRYLRAAERLLFGESHGLAIGILLLLPWAVFRLASVVVGPWVAAGICTLMLLGAPLKAFGLDFRYYADLTAAGWSEPAALLALVLAVAGYLRLLRSDPTDAKSIGSMAAVGAWLAAAALLRSNLLLGAAVIAAQLALVAARRRDGRGLLGLAAGLAPLGLPLAHNLAFAGIWVPFTTAASIAGQFRPAPPETWISAGLDLMRGAVDSPAIGAVAAQLPRWIGGWEQGALLAAALLVLVLPWRLPGTWRWLAAAALALHPPSMFFYDLNDLDRYGQFAWFMSFVLLLCMVAGFGRTRPGGAS
ncbi:MAG: hypothetical protein JNK11_21185 [Alphaproteobacteria bacterium]|nr:hypothetical protein [Alphaproteobacteria bacterium]